MTGSTIANSTNVWPRPRLAARSLKARMMLIATGRP
jgi:hypothetical protein